MTRWNMEALNALYGSGKPPKPRSQKTYTKTRVKCESETIAQQRLVGWMCEQSIIHYAIPNGANVSAHNRARLLAEGLSPGAPDLCIPLARRGYHGLYIELKKEDRVGGLSEAQEFWLARLTAEGYLAEVHYGFTSAKERIAWYVSIEE